MRTRHHVIDVYIPVGPGAGGNPVGPIFAWFGLVIAVSVLVMVAVVFAFPGTDRTSVDYTPVPSTQPLVCAPLCLTPAKSEQR
ncbi:hypothetical protein [Nocardia fluminea]|uniref:hypothetical protein n=1 Tax=Nocardia fluminea TaxID=134984 RepID=UPI00365F94FF